VLLTVALAALTLIAFAANSVLCRLALGGGAIDAASFTTIRVASGAAMLLLVSRLTRTRGSGLGGNWGSAVVLFLYALPFAFAYTTLSTGTGALILFGCVQATMMIAALRAGERPTLLEWAGLAAAIAGLVYLVSPGLSAPDPPGAALMGIAGVSWGLYSLRGRGSSDPVGTTTGNFLRATPLVALAGASLWPASVVSWRGATLALVSGAVTSGLGYVIWYRTLRRITATRAAIVQLPVPLLTAIGGVIVLSESVSTRLVVAAVLILGGVGLAIASRTTRS
jgi:drug/metabolite transporter (DMT)-like permease